MKNKLLDFPEMTYKVVDDLNEIVSIVTSEGVERVNELVA